MVEITTQIQFTRKRPEPDHNRKWRDFNNIQNYKWEGRNCIPDRCRACWSDV